MPPRRRDWKKRKPPPGRRGIRRDAAAGKEGTRSSGARKIHRGGRSYPSAQWNAVEGDKE